IVSARPSWDKGVCMQFRQPRITAKFRTGFTLIELLVVVGIIAILMAILLPALGRARDSAKLVHCASGLRQWGIALHYYYNDYDQWTPQEGDTSDPAVKRDDMWFNALPVYVNAPKYYYVYAGAASRVGETGTDPKTGFNYTVSNTPLSGD